MWERVIEQTYWVYRTAVTPFIILHILVEDVVGKVRDKDK